MSTNFADTLKEAIDKKKNDLNSFIWKGAKKIVNGQRVQEEIKLIDATEEQLKKFYAHCKSMLYSNNKDNPGRYTLLKIIRDQRERCNAELFIRELREPSDPNVKPYPIHLFRQELDDFLDKVSDSCPRSKWNEIPISKVVKVSEDYRSIPINLVRDACLSLLGEFKKKHITLNFLVNMGLWFTKEELKDPNLNLNQIDENGNPVNKLEIVKRNLNLRPDVELHANSKNGLSYFEFRAMRKLYNMRYSEMSKIQLLTLRNKVLFKLEDEAHAHAEFWESKLDQIKKVCEARGISPE